MPVDMDNGIELLIKITKAGDVPGSSLGKRETRGCRSETCCMRLAEKHAALFVFFVPGDLEGN